MDLLAKIVLPFFQVPLIWADDRQQFFLLYAIYTGLQQHQEHLHRYILEIPVDTDLLPLIIQREAA